MELSNLTIEFALPSGTIPDEWLESLRLLWNDTIELLNWRQHYLRVVECGAEGLPPVAIEKIKQGDEYYLHCWIGRDHRIDRSKSWDKDNIEFIPQVKLVPAEWMSPPPVEKRSKFSLCGYFTEKAASTALNYRGENYIPGSLPSGIMQSGVGTAAEAWERYIKSGFGKPKYKSRRFPVQSFDYDGFRSFCKIDGDRIKLLGMDWVTVPGLDRRMGRLIKKTEHSLMKNPSDRTVKMAEKLGLEGAAKYYSQPGLYRLIRRGDKDYLQLAGEFAVTVPIPNISTTNILVGGAHLYTADNGNKINPHDTSKTERRIVNLQKVLASKVFGSANWQKLRDKINAIQRKQAVAKRKHQQYHAQWLTDRYGIINIEKKPPEIVLVPVPIPDGKGGYAPNGAGIVSENNRKAADLATGQFVALIKEQGDRRKRVINDNIKGKSGNTNSDSKSPKKSSQGQPKSNDRQNKGKAKADSLNPISTVPKIKNSGRNRRRERAIG